MRKAKNRESGKRKRKSSFFKQSGESSFFSNNFIQTKLTIGQPGDVYEQEADRMADYVVNNISSSAAMSPGAPGIQNKCSACEEKDNAVLPKLQLQTKEGLPHIQRMGSLADSPEGVREDDDPLYSPMQLKSNGNPQQASEGLSSKLSSSKGGGSALPDHTRSEMESSFGADFSSVRIHTGSSSVQMNQELGAQAFTNGSDVYFNSGKYSPESSGGKHLLAHELTHVVQQGGG